MYSILVLVADITGQGAGKLSRGILLQLDFFSIVPIQRFAWVY